QRATPSSLPSLRLRPAPTSTKEFFNMTEPPQALALWFPLVPRARPVCAPTRQRIDTVTSMAHRARTPAEAAAALNLTALITSDIGDHQLAADMCWRQLGVFTDCAPLEGGLAELAAEPIVNLARLAIREGDGDRAHAILDQVLAAAANLTTASIEGNHIDTEKLVHDAEACA